MLVPSTAQRNALHRNSTALAPYSPHAYVMAIYFLYPLSLRSYGQTCTLLPPTVFFFFYRIIFLKIQKKGSFNFRLWRQFGKCTAWERSANKKENRPQERQYLAPFNKKCTYIYFEVYFVLYIIRIAFNSSPRCHWYSTRGISIPNESRVQGLLFTLYRPLPRPRPLLRCHPRAFYVEVVFCPVSGVQSAEILHTTAKIFSNFQQRQKQHQQQ